MAAVAAAVPNSEAVLGPTVVRNLGDRSYDKRKLGALEVEKMVARYVEAGDQERIAQVIHALIAEFVCDVNANRRKGGLIALAGSAIGLMGQTRVYLDEMVKSVLKCFADQDSRVRYYACESLFNIAKVSREAILPYFDVIFLGLCQLFADHDVDVKNGAVFLDRLIKDIVTATDKFDVAKFIPLLQDHMKSNNAYVRGLLVGWITVLDSVPDIEMLDWLPDILEGLFDMLSDDNRDIRQQAYNALSNFLEAIHRINEDEFEERVKFRPMIAVLVRQFECEEKFNRVTAIFWLHKFIKLGRHKLISVYSQLVEAVLHCISDSEADIREEAKATNTDLMALVNDTTAEFDMQPLVMAVVHELPSKHKYTRTASLRWISMLLQKCPERMSVYIDDVLEALLKTLADESDEVVKITLEVLARISLNDQQQFLRVLKDIIQLFCDNRRLLESRGSFVVRRLCVLLDAKSIYIQFAQILSSCPDREFVSLMIEILNLILLTAEELSDLRDMLRHSSENEEGKAVFKTLYQSWCHNPVSTFSICLLAQAYNLSAALVTRFAEFQVTVGLLMQVDKLVQLLESPVFLQLRLQLLEPENPAHAALLKSLYGLLMLLPQSRAFNTLRNRLMSTTSLHIALASQAKPNAARGSSESQRDASDGVVGNAEDAAELLRHFQAVQLLHYEARKIARQGRSLVSGPGAGGAGGGAAGDGLGDESKADQA